MSQGQLFVAATCFRHMTHDKICLRDMSPLRVTEPLQLTETINLQQNFDNLQQTCRQQAVVSHAYAS